MKRRSKLQTILENVTYRRYLRRDVSSSCTEWRRSNTRQILYLPPHLPDTPPLVCCVVARQIEHALKSRDRGAGTKLSAAAGPQDTNKVLPVSVHFQATFHPLYHTTIDNNTQRVQPVLYTQPHQVHLHRISHGSSLEGVRSCVPVLWAYEAYLPCSLSSSHLKPLRYLRSMLCAGYLMRFKG